jgi:hypothetical protein
MGVDLKKLEVALGSLGGASLRARLARLRQERETPRVLDLCELSDALSARMGEVGLKRAALVVRGRYPMDFATFVCYHAELKKIPMRYPRPAAARETRHLSGGGRGPLPGAVALKRMELWVGRERQLDG